ncbi:MAG: nucleotidyltransferase family protein [Magnetococcales bacterium]|nr:nucleotidyltransferase family protein [Magnetococcales bacterium]
MGRGFQLPEAVLADYCRRHGIRRLSLFGSVLAGTDGPESDLDLLVEFVPEQTPGLLELAAMEEELSRLMEGRPVDLRTPRDLSRHFREQVLASAHVFYGA